MKRLLIIPIFTVLFLALYSPSIQAESTGVYIRPQFKLGKIENGNRFAEIQYVKFFWKMYDNVYMAGGLSTGFTSSRQSWRFNHAINRFGLKVSYQPVKRVGFFFEGSFTDNIPGANSSVSYFVYDNYQSIGVSLELYSLSFE